MTTMVIDLMNKTMTEVLFRYHVYQFLYFQFTQTDTYTMDVVWEYLPCCSKPKASFANQCCMVLTLACSYTGPSVTSTPGKLLSYLVSENNKPK